jgi:cytochrome c oxidase subunit IV
MSDTQTSMEHVQDPHLAEHPSPRKYVNIAIILSIVTALEVAVYYIEAVEDFLVPMLAVMAFVKFVLVAAYFMHLRFDSRIFRRFFVTGLLLAFGVFGIVFWIFFLVGNGPSPGVGG